MTDGEYNMDTQVTVPDKKEASGLKSNRLITWTLNVLMLFYAMSLTMLGPLMPSIVEGYNLQLSEAGLISTFQSIGGIIFTILGGVLADHIKKSRLIGVTFFIYSTSMLAIALAPTYAAILALFFIVGASTRMLDVLLNSYISDLNPTRRGFYINLLGISFSIGGLSGPMFSTLFRNWGMKWNNTFLILGIACTLITVFYVYMQKSVKEDELRYSTRKAADYRELLTSTRLLTLCLIMFIYSGYQSGVSTWMPMFMEKSLLAGPFLSSLAVSLFYIGLIAGRALSSYIFNERQAKNRILFGSLAGGMLLILGIMAGRPVLMAVFSGVSGFLACSVLPLTITFACNYYPESSGAVSSIILLNSVLSWMIFPWLIGFVADNTSFQWGMMTTAICLLLTAILAVRLPSEKSGKLGPPEK